MTGLEWIASLEALALLAVAIWLVERHHSRRCYREALIRIQMISEGEVKAICDAALWEPGNPTKEGRA